jgi:hypothetical protein
VGDEECFVADCRICAEAESEAAAGQGDYRLHRARVVYRRRKGEERVVPYIPDLARARTRHGAFMLAVGPLAPSYMMKYSMKGSGGSVGGSVPVSLEDCRVTGGVQLLPEKAEVGRRNG